MDVTQRSPSGLDRANGESLTDHDEQALETIRRQLDMEFPHYPNTVAAERPAPRRRGRATTVLGLLLACAGGYAAALLFTTLYQALKAPSAVDRQSPTAAPGPVTRIVAATPLATTLPPPLRATTRTEPASRRQATPTPVRPVPDVIRIAETARTSRASSPVAVAPRVPVPPPVAIPPSVEHVASAASAPSTAFPPPKRALVQLASEHIRTAVEAVKERAMQSSGESVQGPRSGPEAP